MDEKISIYQCSHIGVAGTTGVFIKNENGEYEARCGIAIMGMTNMDEEDFERCEYNPFHPEFRDNFASGKGKTEKEAIKNMKKWMNDTAESVWA